MYRFVIFLTLIFTAIHMACSIQNQEAFTFDSLTVSGNQDIIVAEVTRVIDGTTIEVNDNGQLHLVRYSDVEIPSDNALLTEHAERFNRFLVEGQRVQIEKSVIGNDVEGNLSAYVYLDGEMVNGSLIVNGYATVSDTPTSSEHRELLLQMENDARSNLRGIWSPKVAESLSKPIIATNPAAIPSYAGGTLPNMPSASANNRKCDISGNSDAMIKGKVNQANGELNYFLPSDPTYANILVDESNGDKWFCTEFEALAAGWEKSKN